MFVRILLFCLFSAPAMALSTFTADCEGDTVAACDSIMGKRVDTGAVIFSLLGTGKYVDFIDYAGPVNVYLHLWPATYKIGSFYLSPKDSNYCTLEIIAKRTFGGTKIDKFEYSCTQ